MVGREPRPSRVCVPHSLTRQRVYLRKLGASLTGLTGSGWRDNTVTPGPARLRVLGIAAGGQLLLELPGGPHQVQGLTAQVAGALA